MDKAKAAVASIIGKKGHTTEVTENVTPAVTSEHIKPTRHEEIQEAVDREVHQDHYHTTIQPLQHQEILPEKHHHVMKDTINREFHHGNDHETRLRLEREAAQFKNTTHTHETKRTTAAAPRVEGEHVHHHVHETVQPVVHKETITPEVVHTVVPIHEEHHAASQHHGISTLPMKTLESFTSDGGILEGGHKAAHETYDGPPRPYNRDLMQHPTEADLNPNLNHGHHHNGGTGIGSTGASSTNTAPHNSNLANKADPRVDSDMDGRSGLGTTNGTTNGNHRDGLNPATNTAGHTTSDTKPSMMEKIKRTI